MPKDYNHLISEKSPYLLQHAHNPVDWYPWGNKAFNKAQTEKKPIFLSIGYSTCHWCHVMEEESFKDEEVAQILNQHFVAIKVDREERPDVDSIYMEVCQWLTGRGGWPLTIIMTPDKEPFFAGTYFPKESKQGMPGLLNILSKVVQEWEENRNKLLETGEKIVENLKQKDMEHSATEITESAIKDLLTEGFESLKHRFDKEYGGFGTAPKFPQPHNLLFLLRYAKTNNNQPALKMIRKTLDNMWRGGIYDHLGYGFSRYSTDRKWLLPHFEKMLYDNALLTITYLEAYQLIGKEDYAAVSEEILSYVQRDMTAPQGGFYSAEDADSEGEEGKFYLWSQEEIKDILGEKKGQKFCDYYDITVTGNFEGENIPNLIGQDKSKIELDNQFASAKEKLFAQREKRIHPAKDDKILTAWNGLMIAAFAKASRVLGKEIYQEQAEKAVEFIKENLMRNDGRLLARYREGEAAYLGYIDDYAFLIWGLIELYQSSFKSQYLQLAIKLNQDLLHYFWDQNEGGLYLYGSDGEELITRPKKIYDGALPSGNAIAALNFWRLGQLTADESLFNKFEEQIKTFYQQFKANPTSHTASLLSLFSFTDKGREIIVTEDSYNSAEDFLKIINDKYLPFSNVILNLPSTAASLADLNHLFEQQEFENWERGVQICQNYSCQTPISTQQELDNILS
ncbi:thioredoxin domain-containing protein [Halanaerobacter jeridensis]|uniref:Uncharacterized protein YyaL (SSP411 family) n=1 Tax=Halanaerobacter jeridensis TaxID=706427 RepID=A0A938XS52_9FIRM|nr:thioredoxin domain-containing protein [Halanaerobacter jeridensis]MBM7556458.1 uncharacterized protein YyaL (SSP411 family) [Halanaerobacter jeridensis]